MGPRGVPLDDHDEDPSVLKLLGNAAIRRILATLAEGPSYPRAIATALEMSEGDVQRKLHRLERAGLVRGAWRHRGKTVKEYALAASGLDVRLDHGVHVRLSGAP